MFPDLILLLVSYLHEDSKKNPHKKQNNKKPLPYSIMYHHSIISFEKNVQSECCKFHVQNAVCIVVVANVVDVFPLVHFLEYS